MNPPELSDFIQTVDRPLSPTIVTSQSKRGAETKRFIKGPVPVPWLAAANRLSKSALALANVLWLLHGLNGATSFRLEPARCRELSVTDTMKKRGLTDLENAGLIRVTRRRGMAPTVELLSL